jgi:hypothetical protein
MRATFVAWITPATSFFTDLNNLRERGFGTRIAHQDVKSQRLLLGRFGSRKGLCPSFSCLLVSGSGGIACCGTTRHSPSPTPCATAYGWHVVDADSPP